MDSVILKMSPRIIMMASWEQSEKPRQRKLKESDLKPREASAKLLCANLIQFWKRDRLRAVECPKEIIDQIISELSMRLPLSNQNVLITAGPTYEPIDPVRFIGNRSSGKMGVSLAIECANNGANVNLVLGPSNLDVKHSNINIHRVETANEMLNKVRVYFKESNLSCQSLTIISALYFANP